MNRITGLCLTILVLILNAATTTAQEHPATSDTATTAKAVPAAVLTDVDLKSLDDAFRVQRDAAVDAQTAQLVSEKSQLATSRANLVLIATKYKILSLHKLSADEYDVAPAYIDATGVVLADDDSNPSTPPPGAISTEWRIVKKTVAKTAPTK